MDQDANVFIGFAAYDTMKMPTALSLAAAVRMLPCRVGLQAQASAYTHLNREMLLDRALAGSYTHLMFIDTDVVFPPDGIQRLLDAGKDIVGGHYNHKRHPPVSTLKLLGKGTESVLPKRVFEVRAIPTGFMLIRLDAVRDLPRPRFFFDEDDGELVGEDVFFCRLARRNGLKVFCDPTLKIGHVGDFTY